MDQQSARVKKVHADAPVIAVIGCGAIAQSAHLPALARHRPVLERLILVDRDLERATRLARQYEINRIEADYRDVLHKLDGAVVAVPHDLHHSISIDCIKNGIHVLCEKPLAESAAQVHEICIEAEKSGVTVSVNNKRRRFPSSKKVNEMLRQGEIGQPQGMEFSEGEEYDWPITSGFCFGSRGSGKGVLLDKGAHVLDLVCWWLGGKPKLISYEDDSLGGSEAVAKLSFVVGECRGQVHLSWLSKLRNAFRIQGESGSIEGGIFDWRDVTIVSRNGRKTEIRGDSDFTTIADVNKELIDNFLDVIHNRARPLIAAHEVVDSIALIEECYSKRSRFAMPWDDTLYRFSNEE